MDKYCRGCHSGATASKNVVLDNYDGTKNAVMNGKLLQAVRGEVGVTPMPSGGAKLSSCQIVQLEKWAAAGAPNN
jgi:mono/diheme cytochrome c family protein